MKSTKGKALRAAGFPAKVKKVSRQAKATRTEVENSF